MNSNPSLLRTLVIIFSVVLLSISQSFPLAFAATGHASGLANSVGWATGSFCNPNAFAFDKNYSKAYVLNQVSGLLSIINVASCETIDTIKIPTTATWITLLPNNNRAYIPDQTGNISVLDLSTKQLVVSPIKIGSGCGRTWCNPQGNRVYVTHTPNLVAVIDTASNKVIKDIQVGANPLSGCCDSSGSLIFVTNFDDDTISVINAKDYTVSKPIHVGAGPNYLCQHPSGKSMYFCSWRANTISEIRLDKPGMNDLKVDKVIPVGQCPESVEFDPSGKLAFTADRERLRVGVIDTENNLPLGYVAVPGYPFRLGIAPQGDSLICFVTLFYHNNVSWIKLPSVSECVSRSRTSAPDFDYLAEYQSSISQLKSKYLSNNPLMVAHDINDLSELCRIQGRNAESEPLCKESLAIEEQNHGSPWQIALTQTDLASIYRGQGRYSDAEPLYKRALQMIKDNGGTGTDNEAIYADYLAFLYMDMGRYSEAEPLYHRAKEVYAKNYNPEHPLVGYTLDYLASLYQIQGRYREAQIALEHSLAIKIKYLGETHDSVGSAYKSLGLLSEAQQEYVASEPYYLNSMRIAHQTTNTMLAKRTLSAQALAKMHTAGEQSVPGKSPNLEISNLMSQLSSDQQRYGSNSLETSTDKLKLACRLISIGGSGQTLVQEAFAGLRSIAENLAKAPSKNTSNVAKLLQVSNLMMCTAYLLSDQGINQNANIAASLAMQTLKLASNGHETIGDATQLLAIGAFFGEQAQYADAKEALSEVQLIAEKLKDKRLLCNALLAEGRVDMAEADFSGAFAVASKALQKAQGFRLSSQQTADVLDELADCSEALGKYPDAIMFAQRSLKAKDPSGTSKSILTLPTLLTLGHLHTEQKNFTAAKSELTRALAIAVSSGDTTLRSSAYAALGDLAIATGNLTDGRLWVSKAREINYGRHGQDGLIAFARNLNTLGRIDALDHDLKTARQNVLWAARILSQYVDVSFGQLSFAEQCAFTDTLFDQTDYLLSTCTDSESLAQAYEFIGKWKGLLIESLRKRTALQQAMRGNPKLQLLVDQRSAKHRELEILADQTSANMSPGEKKKYDADLARITGDSETLDRQITKEAGSIEVLDPMSKKGPRDLQHILHPKEALIQFVEYRNKITNTDQYAAIALTSQSGPTLINLQGAVAIDKAVKDWRAGAFVPGLTRDAGPNDDQAVEMHYVEKLGVEKTLHTALRKMLYAPISEALRGETVEALWICPDGATALVPWSIFADDRKVCVVDSPRELMSLRDGNKPEPTGAKTLLLAANIAYGDPSLNLPFAKDEFKSLDRLAKTRSITVTPFDGKTAVEKAVLHALPSSTYAHFATHGFYSGSDSQSGPGRGTRSSIRARQTRDGSSYLIDTRNPLMTSGLLLSGAKREGTVNGEDRLTADNFVGLDLHNCSLVALSACQTGLGKQLNGQGVLGLRSAIIGAGAQNILMSLWNVNDKATSMLMEKFYQHLWSGKSPVDSLSAAQTELKGIKQYEHPFFWGGWVIAGNGL